MNGNDSILYQLAEQVFEAFNKFMDERNRVVGTDNPITYVSDEDGKTLIYTRGEYAEELINNINKIHGHDPLKHQAFKSAIQLADTAELVAELEKRDWVESHGISESYHASIIHEIECFDPIEVFGPAKILVVKEIV